MTETAHGMIQNFLFLVSREALPVLEKEYQFWMQNRSVVVEVSGSEHVLNRYNVEADLPRAELCMNKCRGCVNISTWFWYSPLASELKQQLWMDLKAGAESGWDFTSRWYINGTGHNDGTLRETRTSQILPTDLNALLCRNERTLASFHRLLGEPPTLDAASVCF
ncbi:hypothetical protein GOODEAATRI_008008 [Goodea atripinnis]|uniref:Trehalase n=1 Tax=Goodea atripinnis TaxID=208336 RepID=A0ABV0MG03_9TELE